VLISGAIAHHFICILADREWSCNPLPTGANAVSNTAFSSWPAIFPVGANKIICFMGLKKKNLSFEYPLGVENESDK
jgi:hypothetical protein